jgi:hypothetical protein
MSEHTLPMMDQVNSELIESETKPWQRVVTHALRYVKRMGYQRSGNLVVEGLHDQPGRYMFSIFTMVHEHIMQYWPDNEETTQVLNVAVDHLLNLPPDDPDFPDFTTPRPRRYVPNASSLLLTPPAPCTSAAAAASDAMRDGTMPSLRMLIYGDSLAAGLTVDSVLCPQCTFCHVESKPGYTTYDLIADEDNQVGISMLLEEDKYDVLLLVMGTNDTCHGLVTAQEMADNIWQLYRKAQLHARAPRLILVACPDDPFKSYAIFEDARFAHVWPFFCEDMPIQFRHEDGIHLNEAGKTHASIDLSLFLMACLEIDAQDEHSQAEE